MVRAFYTERKEHADFFLTRSPLVEHKRKESVKDRKRAEYRAMDQRKRPEKSDAPSAPKVPLASPKGP